MKLHCEMCGNDTNFIKTKIVAEWDAKLEYWIDRNEKPKIECDNCGSVRVVEKEKE